MAPPQGIDQQDGTMCILIIFLRGEDAEGQGKRWMRPRLGECACVYVRFADFRLSMNHVLRGRGEWWRWT